MSVKLMTFFFDYAVPSPPNLYPTTRANVGKMENRGIEIMINFTPFDKKNLVGRPALVSPQIKINS